ncbi:MAG: hypothetical protein RR432_06585, partial [Alistipes sp.]
SILVFFVRRGGFRPFDKTKGQRKSFHHIKPTTILEPVERSQGQSATVPLRPLDKLEDRKL